MGERGATNQAEGYADASRHQIVHRALGPAPATILILIRCIKRLTLHPACCEDLPHALLVVPQPLVAPHRYQF
jgi:hypothetical protein